MGIIQSMDTITCGMDLVPPADIVGDIRDWENLGLKEESFDVIVAFEVVEHVDCFQECWVIKPGGVLFTSPVPHMDWAMKVLEELDLTKNEQVPHDHLVFWRCSF